MCFFRVFSRHEEAKLASLRSELQALRDEVFRLKGDATRNKRQVGEVMNRLKRKTDERNQLKREITELKNAQEEEETEVDTATYVSQLYLNIVSVWYLHVTIYDQK